MELGDKLKDIGSQWEALQSSDKTRQLLFEVRSATRDIDSHPNIGQQVLETLKYVTAENQNLREKIDNLEYHERNYQRDLRSLQDEQSSLQEQLVRDGCVRCLARLTWQ